MVHGLDTMRSLNERECDGVASVSTPRPISDEVAFVAFDGEKPVILCSVDIRAIVDTIFDCLVGGSDESDDDEKFIVLGPEVTRELLLDAATRLRWVLYRTEDAKALFCSAIRQELQLEMFP